MLFFKLFISLHSPKQRYLFYIYIYTRFQKGFHIERCIDRYIPWIIQRLDRKLMSRGLISYRRLVGSCSKMALDGSIIVEICDETMAKMWRKPVEMQGFFACMLFFFGFFSGTLIFGGCFFLRLLSYGDGDPSKPHLNLQGKHFLLLFCVICPCL